ncbi:hypothetical protein TEA_015651 [Camellia sinensis var. sinensis]|uniref:Uncharacterized protein n=1 Tax=Camellia sinensis var. sinensis TaxID=542762 RepID=A0A4S4EEB8_CAMSN|nr:hypothetical protein TEA_015651 [Camellia sinensis var. sinensis]
MEAISFTIWSLCSTFLFLALIFFLFFRKKINANLLPPGPKPWPFIGCLPQMLRNKPTFRWIHKLMEEMNVDIMCIRLGNVHVIPVTSPEIAREFLRRQDAVFASRPVCLPADIASGGYLSAALSPMGDQWKKMRKVLTSEVLSTSRHRWLHDKRVEEADHLIRFVYNQCMNSATGGLVNVRVVTQHFCGNLIRKMIFNKRFFGKGMEDGGPGVEEEEHVNALFTILSYLYSFCVSDYIPCIRGVLDLDGHEKIMRKATTSVKKYQDPLIDERIKQWNDGTKTEKEDILDILITLKQTDGAALVGHQFVLLCFNIAVIADSSESARDFIRALLASRSLRGAFLGGNKGIVVGVFGSEWCSRRWVLQQECFLSVYSAVGGVPGGGYGVSSVEVCLEVVWTAATSGWLKCRGVYCFLQQRRTGSGHAAEACWEL